MGKRFLLFLLLLSGCAVPTAERAFTFAVLGDNRGGYDGTVEPVFLEIVQSIQRDRPELVFNTGDMVCGRTDEEGLRQQWEKYKEAIAPLSMPMHHVPGNHDIDGEMSAGVYREYCGEPYYALDYAGCRFIGLDTETNYGGLGKEQFRWLRRQLATGRRPVFIFMHRPLFSAGIYGGSSMDAETGENGRLHRLFVSHRWNIRAVFAGHEHMYHFQERDGIRYYITGGGGAWLYATPEAGGVHHYLLVRVAESDTRVEVRRAAEAR